MSEKIQRPNEVVGEVIKLAEDDEEFLPHKKGDLFHVIRYNGNPPYMSSPYLVGYWDDEPVPANEDEETFVRHSCFEQVPSSSDFKKPIEE